MLTGRRTTSCSSDSSKKHRRCSAYTRAEQLQLDGSDAHRTDAGFRTASQALRRIAGDASQELRKHGMTTRIRMHASTEPCVTHAYAYGKVILSCSKDHAHIATVVSGSMRIVELKYRQSTSPKPRDIEDNQKLHPDANFVVTAQCRLVDLVATPICYFFF